MSIAVQCQCGQRFKAPPKLAGKAVKCPKCGQPLRIPQASQAAPPQAAPQPPASPPAGHGLAGGSLFDDDLGGAPPEHACPECHAPMSAEAILCIHCGFNVQTGRRVGSFGVNASEKPVDYGTGHAGETARLMARAASEVEKEAQSVASGEEDSIGSAWLLTAIMGTVTLVAVGAIVAFFTFMEAGSKTDENGEPIEATAEDTGAAVGILATTCLAVSALCGLVSFGAFVAIVVNGFKESSTQGLLCFFVPFYAFVYAIMRREDNLKYLLIWLGAQVTGVLVIGISIAIAAASVQ